jgi:hypothetical protein
VQWVVGVLLFVVVLSISVAVNPMLVQSRRREIACSLFFLFLSGSRRQSSFSHSKPDDKYSPLSSFLHSVPPHSLTVKAISTSHFLPLPPSRLPSLHSTFRLYLTCCHNDCLRRTTSSSGRLTHLCHFTQRSFSWIRSHPPLPHSPPSSLRLLALLLDSQGVESRRTQALCPSSLWRTRTGGEAGEGRLETGSESRRGGEEGKKAEWRISFDRQDEREALDGALTVSEEQEGQGFREIGVGGQGALFLLFFSFDLSLP